MYRMTHLPVHRHEKSARCLALAAGDSPVTFDPQRPTILLLPPISSNNAHNPAAWLLCPGPLEFLRVVHVLYRGLGCQLWYQVLRGSVVWDITLATSRLFLNVGKQSASKREPRFNDHTDCAPPGHPDQLVDA